MRYWAYLDKKVCGPFEKEKLAELPGFGLSCFLCPDAPGGGQPDAWKEASAYPEVLAVLTAAPAPAQPPRPAAETPLMMTMRGTLIEEPEIELPAQDVKPAAVPGQPRRPAETPLMMTMRGTLIEEPEINEPAPEAPKTAPGAGLPAAARPLPENSAGPAPEPLGQKLEQMSAVLGAVRDNQALLLARLDRIESAVAAMKALLFPAPPVK